LQNEINELYGLPVRLEFLRPELLGPGTDWQNELFKDAVQQNHQISFSGGKDGTNFFLSAGYTDQQGIIIGSEFDRITLRANVNSKINDWISVGAAITASRTNEDLIMNNSEQGAITLALTQNPSSAVYNADGSFAGPNIDDDFMQRNPIADILSRENNLLRNRLLGNLYAEFTLFEGLKYRTEFGGDFGNTMNDRFQSTYEYGEIVSGTNILNVRRENNDFWVIKNLLTFNKNFNDRHDLTVLLG